jgi:ribosomal protein S18 acetylase RimI-like enzyme
LEPVFKESRILRVGETYKKFATKNGKTVTLRAIRWEDLGDLLDFANSLVDERNIDPEFGIILDKSQTLKSEADWLATKLVSIETGEQISVVAELDGKLIGNSEVDRGRVNDEFYHGKLAISVLKEFRNLGIGLEMMKTLLDQSRKAGLKTIELEVFANNPRAVHVYETVGFKQIGKIPKKIFRKGRHIDIIVMAIEL